MRPLNEQHLLLHQIKTKAFSSTLKKGLDMLGRQQITGFN